VKRKKKRKIGEEQGEKNTIIHLVSWAISAMPLEEGEEGWEFPIILIIYYMQFEMQLTCTRMCCC
jgi:hypothetical protein